MGEFAGVFCALWAAHSVGDHWVQTGAQAAAKGLPGWAGRRACARHVVTLTLTKVLALVVVGAVTGWRPGVVGLLAGLGVDAVSHYWADRRTPLADLALAIGKSGLQTLGDKKVAPCGTGAYALDQSWHIGWLFVAALAIA